VGRVVPSSCVCRLARLQIKLYPDSLREYDTRVVAARDEGIDSR